MAPHSDISLSTIGLDEVLRTLSQTRGALRGKEVRRAWRKGGALLVRYGRQNLAPHNRTGEISRSFLVDVDASGRRMRVGFKKKGTLHAGWVHAMDKGHEAANAYGRTGKRVKGTNFWTKVREDKTPEALRTVADGVLLAVARKLS